MAALIGYRNTGTNQIVWVATPVFDGNPLWVRLAGSGTGGGDVTLADLAAVEADTTNIHGIPNTANLETVSGSADKVATHAAQTTTVHGIANTALLETIAGSTARANAAAAASIPLTQKGAANGVATLGSDSKIPANQVPQYALNDFLTPPPGNQAAMLALDGALGDWTIRTDLGTTWLITGADPTQLSNWHELSYPPQTVTSVAGKVGNVALAGPDIVSGLIPYARIPIGTTAGTVAAGDDSRFGSAGSAPEAVVNVADFGAVGDGVANDTASIQAALTAAPAGSTVVLAPGKNYSVAGLALTNKTDVTIDGRGAKLTYRSTGARIGLALGGTCTNVTIQNVTFIGNAVLADGHAGVYCNSGQTITNLKVINNRMMNLTVGVSLSADGSGSISGATIQGNHIENVIGTTSGNGYGVFHSSSDVATHQNVRIVGNTIIGAQQVSINQFKGLGVLIASNMIKDHRLGVATGVALSAIIVQRSGDVAVVGNVVSRGSDSAITIGGVATGTLSRSHVVTGNVFTSPRDTVPLMIIGQVSPASEGAPDSVVVTGNSFWSAQAGGFISLYSGRHVRISANVMQNTSTTGTATGVRMFAAGESGPSALYTDDVVIDGNTINMATGGTKAPFNLTGVEGTAIALQVTNNKVTAPGNVFLAPTTVTNPNIVIAGQAATGITGTAWKTRQSTSVVDQDIAAAITTHSSAPDPHGDRAYADSLALSGGNASSTYTNVKSFGAVGNGVANDTAAINAALAAVAATRSGGDGIQKGGVLFFPPGTYLTDGNHDIPSYVHILGCEPAGRYWVWNPTDVPTTSCAIKLRTGTSSPALFTISATSTAWSIQDISLLGSQTGTGIDGINFVTPVQEHNSIVENVAIIGFSGDGVRGRLFATRWSKVFIGSNQGYGLNCDGSNAWTDSMFADMYVTGNKLGGVNFDSTGHCGEISFTDCRFERSGWDVAHPTTPVATNSPGIRIHGTLIGAAFTSCSTDANSGNGVDIVRPDTTVNMHHIQFTACRFNRDGFGTMAGSTAPDRAAVRVSGTSSARIGYISFAGCITTEGHADDGGGAPAYVHAKWGLWWEYVDYCTWHGGSITEGHPGGKFNWLSVWRPSVYLAAAAGSAVWPVWTTSTRPTVNVVGGHGWNEETSELEAWDGSGWATVGSGGGTTPPSTSDGHRLMIFYSPPQVVNELYDDEAAAQLFSGYDQIVFGEDSKNPSDDYYASTLAIIARIKQLNTRAIIFGYVNMGEGGPTISAMQANVQQWITAGATGIFFDTVEYAYGVHRSTMNTMVNYVHGLGLPAAINGYAPDDVMGSAVDATYNPTGTPTAMDERDWYMLEDFVVEDVLFPSTSGVRPMADLREAADKARSYRASLGVKIMAVGLLENWSTYTTAQLDNFWGLEQAAALVFGVDTYGLSPKDYSASDPTTGVVRNWTYWSGLDTDYETTSAYSMNGPVTEATRLGVVFHNEPGNHTFSLPAGGGGGGGGGGGVTLAQLQAHTVLTVSRSAGADYLCDGTADQTEIQQAINAVVAAGGGTVLIKAGTYNLTAGLDVTGPVNGLIIAGEGTGATKLITSNTSNDPALQIQNTPDPAGDLALTVSTNVGDRSITMSSGNAATLAVGDWLLLKSNKIADTESTTKFVGEIKQVTGIASGVVSVNDIIHDTYLTTDSARVVKIVVVQNVTVRDFSVSSSATQSDLSTGFLDFRFCSNLTVRNIEMHHAWHSLQLRSCINSLVEGCYIHDIDEPGPRPLPSDPGDFTNLRYGIWVANASQNVVINACRFRQVRHAITFGTNSGTNGNGVQRNVVVSNCVSQESDTAHYDAHRPVDGITFIGCSAIGGMVYQAISGQAVVGYQSRGKNVSFIGCMAHSIPGRGFMAQGAEADNTRFIGCTASDIQEKLGGGEGVGFYVDSGGSTRHIINGCIVLGSDAAGLNSTNLSDDCVVTNNVFENTGRAVSTAAVKFANANRGVFANNRVLGTSSGAAFQLTGTSTNWQIYGNSFTNTGGTTVPALVGTNSCRDNIGCNPDWTVARGNLTGAQTFDLAQGSAQTFTMTGNITATVPSGLTPGNKLRLILKQDATGSRTWTKPGNVLVAGGSFVPTAAANAVSQLELEWDGTNWLETSRSLNLS